MTRIFDKLFSGRFLMLVSFGSTICVISLGAAWAVFFQGKADDKYISILTFFAGYLTGAFSKIWDSYAHRQDRYKPGINQTQEEENEKNNQK